MYIKQNLSGEQFYYKQWFFRSPDFNKRTDKYPITCVAVNMRGRSQEKEAMSHDI